ncbi:hypothetical protein [Natronobiforma cellulositropha]|uniref:hypothetical protein n=1 Tax=Natronobiforma cellulositropha TaxID=1679076 RepID=UPI0021D57AC2|nr:hypothetical protein [Natronobiforma cellulositropha]
MTDDLARMELGADAWHQDEEGGYYIDCPECGSAATLSNVTAHGRCNGYLEQYHSDTDVDERELSCTALLTLELAYTSDPDAGIGDPHVANEDESAAEDEGAVSGADAPGVRATVDTDDSSE